jgi:hypothetical protein
MGNRPCVPERSLLRLAHAPLLRLRSASLRGGREPPARWPGNRHCHKRKTGMMTIMRRRKQFAIRLVVAVGLAFVGMGAIGTVIAFSAVERAQMIAEEAITKPLRSGSEGRAPGLAISSSSQAARPGVISSPPLHDPHGRVTWQSISDGGNSLSRLAARRRGRSWRARRRRCR